MAASLAEGGGLGEAGNITSPPQHPRSSSEGGENSPEEALYRYAKSIYTGDVAPSPILVHAALVLVSVLFGLNYVASKLVVDVVPPRAWDPPPRSRSAMFLRFLPARTHRGPTETGHNQPVRLLLYPRF